MVSREEIESEIENGPEDLNVAICSVVECASARERIGALTDVLALTINEASQPALAYGLAMASIQTKTQALGLGGQADGAFGGDADPVAAFR